MGDSHSQPSANGAPETPDSQMEFLRSRYHDKDNLHVLRRFYSLFNNPGKDRDERLIMDENPPLQLSFF